MNEQQRLEVQTAIQQYIDSLMTTYSISASMIEDAMNKVLIGIKDKSIAEFLQAVQKQQQHQEELSKKDRPEVDNGDRI